MVKSYLKHDWRLTPSQAREIQQKLACKVIRKTDSDNYHLIAAADISIKKGCDIARAAIVIVSYPHFAIKEVALTTDKIQFPYIPGLLSFREAPLLMATFNKLSIKPDLLLVDGQGIAHPRRFGLASHLGIMLDIPTIGCAKSCLCGSHDILDQQPGHYVRLLDNGETIGAAVRTKSNTKPIYVSIGHKIDLPSAVKWTINCCTKYRVPEPLRLAHLYANAILTADNSTITQTIN
jgi:deoxyribonuclease V